jgi:cytochrome c peroxidase
MGGPLLDQPGIRNAPSLRYLAFSSGFHFADDGTPRGGLFWDGRASSLKDQAASPILGPSEMANASTADAVARLARATYAAEFRALFGADIFDRPDDAFDRLTLALQSYQLEDAEFRAFTSKYDEFLRGNVALGDQELRGLALFNDPSKGNCQACHPSARAADGRFPLFTDFTYDNLGVPRNPTLARNADPAYFDLGLCARPGLADRTDLCGAFKVPSLRNVAERRAYFHNGRFGTLKDVVTFYAQRDTNPEKFYSVDANGQVRKFDDLPPAWHANVNTTEVPYNRGPGDAPALSDAEVDDVVAFLRTLSDGYRH